MNPIKVDPQYRLATQPKTLEAKFDLAQTTPHSRRHWANADGLAARASMSAPIRALVRKRSRYEFDNNSWYRGMLRTASNHIVGTGPRLQVLTPNAEGNARIEKAWRKWSRAVHLAEKLRVSVETYWKDGGMFAMRTTRPRLWPISLDIRLYEAEQCATPWIGRSLGDPLVDDGVRTDANTNEVEFYFYDNHPGDVTFTPTFNGDWYPADDVVHLMRRERPGQVRGIPRATCSLNTLPIMRRQEMATLLAAETAASFATFLKSSSSALDPKASPTDFAEIEIAYNMLTTLPAGWEIDQVDGKHPGPQYEMFQRQALMSFSRCTNMPYALAAGTSKDSNFSSLRGDMKNVWEPEVKVEQDRLECCFVEKVWRWFLEEAVYAPGLLDGMPSIHEIDHVWTWPPVPELDEVKSATAAKIRLSTGQSCLSDEHARAGTDYKTKVETMASDLGVTTDEMKRLIRTTLYPEKQPGMPGGTPGQPAAPVAAAPAGEYTELGQRHFTNNQKRINNVLSSLAAGDISEGRARLDLQSIGLTADTIDGYIADAVQPTEVVVV